MRTIQRWPTLMWIFFVAAAALSPAPAQAQTVDIYPPTASVIAGDTVVLMATNVNTDTNLPITRIYLASGDPERLAVTNWVDQQTYYETVGSNVFLRYYSIIPFGAIGIKRLEGRFDPIPITITATRDGGIVGTNTFWVSVIDPSLWFTPASPALRVGDIIPVAVHRSGNAHSQLDVDLAINDRTLLGLGMNPLQLDTNTTVHVAFEPYILVKTVYLSALAMPGGQAVTNGILSASVGSYTNFAVVTVTADDALVLTPATPSVTAGDALNMTVTRTTVTNSLAPLLVALSSDHPDVAGVPPSVIIPVGARSVDFPVSGVTPGASVIRASAIGMATNSASARAITVTNPTLTVAPSPVNSVVGGVNTVTIIRPSHQAAASLTVHLASSDPSVATVDAENVTIPAGFASATFPVSGMSAGTAILQANVGTYTTTNTILVSTAGLILNAPPVRAGDTAVLTITRYGSLSGDLNVTLESADPLSLTLPGGAQIPNGQSNVYVTLTGVKTSGGVIVEAMAAGYSAGTLSIPVLDPVLTFTNTPYLLQVGEVLPIELRRDPTFARAALTLEISSGDASIFTVNPITVTFNAYEISKIIQVTGVRAGMADVRAQVGTYLISQPVTVVAGSNLVLSAGNTVTAGSTTNMLVTRVTATPAALYIPLVVNLASDDPNGVTVPPTVTIPAGLSNTTFTITGVAPLGTPVIIRASADGYPNVATNGVTVLPPSLTIMPTNPISLLVAGQTFATVSRGSQFNSAALTVQLYSGNPAVFTLASNTVTIPAGLDSASFSLIGVSGGTNNLFAAVGNYSVAREVRVEYAFLQLSPTNVLAGDTANMTVTRVNGSMATPLTVSLLSYDPAFLTVPPNVVIPAGVSNANFTITGMLPHAGVTVLAQAVGYADTNVLVAVNNPHLSMAPATRMLKIGQASAFSLSRPFGESKAELNVALAVVPAAGSSGSIISAPSSVVLTNNQPSINIAFTAVSEGTCYLRTSVGSYTFGSSPPAPTGIVTVLPPSPFLLPNIRWLDNDSNNVYSAGDVVDLTFNSMMATDTVTLANLLLKEFHSPSNWLPSLTGAWGTNSTIAVLDSPTNHSFRITLGSAAVLDWNMAVDPNDSVTDIMGDPDATFPLVLLPAPGSGADSDNDGIPDWWEFYYFGDLATARVVDNPADPEYVDGYTDWDFDGLNDFYEFLCNPIAAPWSTNSPAPVIPALSDIFGDLDGDLLVNLEEQWAGTHPRLADTDDDFMDDLQEVAANYDPVNSLIRFHWRSLRIADNTGAVTFNDQDDTDLRAFTVSAWIKPLNADGGVLVRKTGAASRRNFELGLLAASNIPYFVFDRVTGLAAPTNRLPAGLPSNQWSFVAASRSASNQLALYAWIPTGTSYRLVSWTTNSGLVPATGQGNTYLGAAGASAPAGLDEVRIWNYARTAGELLADRDVALSGAQTGLVSYFRFDDGGITVEDFRHPIARSDRFAGLSYVGQIAGAISFTNAMGIGLAATDTDQDGLPDWWEYQYFGTTTGASPDGDEDGDGVNNGWEFKLNGDPFNAYSLEPAGLIDDGEWDSDGDSLANADEILLLGTSPADPDTDDDNFSDGDELDAYTVCGDRRLTSPLYSRSPLIQRSMVMNGSAVELPDGASNRFNLAAWTLEAWVNPATVAETGNLIVRRTATGKTNFALRLNANVPQVCFTTLTGERVNANSGQPLPSNSWSYVAGVWDPTNHTLQLYVNGVMTQAQVSVQTPATGSGITAIGEGLSGRLDEVRIWNVARKPAEIALWVRTHLLAGIASSGAAMVDFVFVIDATGSMGSVIDNVKANVVSFLTALRDQGIDAQVAGVDYRDPLSGGGGSDEVPHASGFFTDGATLISSWLDPLSASGGGDTPEDGLGALVYALSPTSFSPSYRLGAQKIFLLITDTSVKDIEDSDTGAVLSRASVISQLLAQDVTVHGISRGDADVAEIVARTGGTMYDIDSSTYTNIFASLAASITGAQNAPSLLAAYYVFDDGQNTGVTNLLDGLATGHGAEDFVHQLDWDYALTNVVFDTNAVPILEAEDLDANKLPDWWERMFFGGSAALDDDPDGDELQNYYEWLFDTNPGDMDTDDDGIRDGRELSGTNTISNLGLQLTVTDPSGDYDNDGLNNANEGRVGTDPIIADSDSDGIPDGQEDADLDGLSNAQEQALGSSLTLTDTDDDGLPDGNAAESDPTSALLPLRDRVLALDGATNSYVEMPAAERFALTDWTLLAWVKPATADGGLVLARQLQPGVTNYALALNANRQLTLAFTPGDWTVPVSVTAPLGKALATGVWSHVAGTFDGAQGKLSLYIDGDLVASTLTAKRPATVGSAPWTRLGAGFAGQLDEVGICRAALGNGTNGATIRQLMNGIATVPNINGEMLYYRFDDGTSATNAGSDWRGTSGNTNWTSGQVEDFAPGWSRDWANSWSNAGTLHGAAAIVPADAAAPVKFTTLDSDVDGLPDWWELKYYGNATNAGATADSDNDDVNDLWEYRLGGDPQNPYSLDPFGLVNDGEYDSDGDRLANAEEIEIWGSDPTDPDTDDDTFEDGDELDSNVPCGDRRITSPVDSRSPLIQRSMVLTGVPVELPATSEAYLDRSAWLIDCWVKLTNAVNSGRLVTRTTFTGQTNFCLRIADNAPSIEFTTPAGIRYSVGGGAELPLNVWNHLVGSWNPEMRTLELWVNDVSFRAQAVAGTCADGPGRVMLGDTGLYGFLDNAIIRSPLLMDVVFVLDVSGSMEGEKLDSLKRATTKALDMLPLDMPVGLVTFSSEATNLTQGFSTDRARLKSLVQGLAANGGTDYLVAHDTATNLVQTSSSFAKHLEIFISDGAPNEGVPTDQQLMDAANLGIVIHTIGFQLADPLELQRLSSLTGGNFYDAPTDADLEAAFADILKDFFSVTYWFDDGDARAEDFDHPLNWDYAITNVLFTTDTWVETAIADKDSDGLPDWWELLFFEGDADPLADRDHDGLNNLNEYRVDANPLDDDSDNDGILDGAEDSDQDTLSNAQEQYLGAHPMLPDTDDDGIVDGDETLFNPTNALVPLVDRVLELNGSAASYLELPAVKRYALTNWTLQAWMKPANLAAPAMLIGRQVQTNVWNYYLGVETNRKVVLAFTAGDTLTNTVSVTMPAGMSIPTGVWTHVAGCFDGDTGELSLYLNGDLVAQTTTSRRPAVNGIGPTLTRVGPGFAGLLDEAAIVRRAFGPAEVEIGMEGLALYDSAADAVGFYRFDDGTHPSGASGNPAWLWGQVQEFAPGYGSDWLNRWANAGTLVGGATTTTNVGPHAPVLYAQLDFDGDGLPNWWELAHGLDPDSAVGDDGALGDPDLDGVNNLYEYLGGTDPQWHDSNNDLIPDDEEDPDSDGLPTLIEQWMGTLPLAADTDDDGLYDGEEVTGSDNAASPLSPVGTSDPLYSLDPPAPRSMLFNGQARVIVPPQNKLMAASWTVEAWVNPTNSHSGVILSRYVEDPISGMAGVNYELGVMPALDPDEVVPYVRYQARNGTNMVLTATNGILPGIATPIALNEWTHLAGTYNATNHRMELYINGSLIAYRIDATILPPTSFGLGSEHIGDEVTIGAGRSTVTPIPGGFQGYLDEVRVWPGARSGDEIRELYRGIPLSIGGALTAGPAYNELTPAQKAAVDAKLAAAAQAAAASGGKYSVGYSPVLMRDPAALCGRLYVSNPGPSDPSHLDQTAFNTPLPAAFNWVDRNGVTPVKDQGSCGSCWAFSTVAAFESAIRIANRSIADLSEQYLVSCNLDGWGCIGGLTAHKYHYDTAAADGLFGAVLESDFPYAAADVACGGPYPRPYVLDGWKYLGLDDNDLTIPDETIKEAIYLHGPVMAALYVDEAFTAYSGGIFNTDEISPSGHGNHTLLIVGWNDAQNCWIAKNQWGTGWGENGYIRIAYGTSGIGEGASYVLYGAAATPNTLALDMRFDDGGATAEDFTAAADWLNGWASAGILDGAQFTNTTAEALDQDTDGDGMPDWWEVSYQLDPNRDDAGEDPDGDGLTNLYEFYARLNPHLADTDLNGVNDDLEDSDSDGLSNLYEQQIGTRPDLKDTDDDGVEDGNEVRIDITNPLHSMSSTNWIERCLNLAGISSNGIVLPDRERFAFGTNGWTVEFWIKPGNDGDGLVFETTSPSAGQSLSVGIENYRPIVKIYSGTNILAQAGGIGPAGSIEQLRSNHWSHVAAVWAPDRNSLEIYIDGLLLIAQQTLVAPVFSSGKPVLAKGFTAGWLDEIRIWNYDRKADEVGYWFNRLFPSQDASVNVPVAYGFPLVLYFRFDDSGATVEDFAHVNDPRAAIQVDPAAILPSGIALLGTDDVDSDLLPEWWARLHNLDMYPTTQIGPTPLYISPLADGAADAAGRVRINYLRTFTAYASIGTDVAWPDEQPVYYSPKDDSLGPDGRYSAFMKYVYLRSAPQSATLEIFTPGMESTLVYVNGQRITPADQETNIIQRLAVESYLHAGRNMVYVRCRSLTAEYQDINRTLPGKLSGKVFYEKALGKFDARLTCDGQQLIVRGDESILDPRAVWRGQAWSTWRQEEESSYEPIADKENRQLPGNQDYGLPFDVDEDGLNALYEFSVHTNPRDSDSDNNGVPDGFEDFDQDNLINREEQTRNTDPLLPDTDDDGYYDGPEAAVGNDPAGALSPSTSRALTCPGGANDFLTFPKQSRFALENWTIEAWVRLAADATNGGVIVQRLVGANAINYELGLGDGSEIARNVPYVRYVSNRGTNVWTTNAAALPPTGTNWVHLAATYNASLHELKLYTNGALVSTASQALDAPALYAGGPVVQRIGAGFQGALDEVRLWGNARSASEINANYTKTVPGTTPNLIAYYRFDDGTSYTNGPVIGTSANNMIPSVGAITPWTWGQAQDFTKAYDADWGEKWFHAASFHGVTTFTAPGDGAIVIPPSLRVTLQPPAVVTAGALWAPVGAGQWYHSGDTIYDGLTPGLQEIMFTTVYGWTAPTNVTVVLSNGVTTTYTAFYVLNGALRVTLNPAEAVAAGAQWRVDGGGWTNSGEVVENLSPTNHAVTFKDVNNWITPPLTNVHIQSGVTSLVMVSYLPVTASLQIFIDPPEVVSAGGQWSVDGGPLQLSGSVVTGLLIGTHRVQYTDVPPWTTPTPQDYAMTNSALVVGTGFYVQVTGIMVDLVPPEAVAAGARWNINGGQWNTSGALIPLSPGSYTVGFKTLGDTWATPESVSVVVSNARTTRLTGSYYPYEVLGYPDPGSGAIGFFRSPRSVVYDAKRRLYVADTLNNRIQVRNPRTGAWQQLGYDYGTAPGYFKQPHGLSVDGSTNLFVADTINDRIQKYAPFSGVWSVVPPSGTGTNLGYFSSPKDVAVDTNRNLYVADYGNNRVQRMATNGSWMVFVTNGYPDRFVRQPQGLTLDVSNNLFVADYDASTNRSRIQRFAPSGSFQGRVGSSDSLEGGLNRPWGMTFDNGTNATFYVADYDNDRIAGATNLPFGWFTLVGSTTVNKPADVAHDPRGYLCVADSGNNRVILIKLPTATNNPGPYVSYVATNATNGYVISWNGIYGWLYTVQYAPMPTGTWADLPDPACVDIPGINGTMTCVDTNFVWPTNRFYRVAVY